jgi:hypothetical protein
MKTKEEIMNRFGKSNLLYGAYGGVVGGIVFGIMMAMMGMMPMIGQMIGMPDVISGWIVHLIISVVTGLIFAVIYLDAVTSIMTGIIWGAIYGFIWWILGPLTLMPFFLGMGLGVNWTLAALASQLPSLIGHIIFGVLLGGIYAWLKSNES